jgi:hypothetical protein
MNENDSNDEIMYQYIQNNVYFHNMILYLTNHQHHNHVINLFSNKLIEIVKNYIRNIEIVHDDIRFQYLIMMILNKYNVQWMLMMDNYEKS